MAKDPMADIKNQMKKQGGSTDRVDSYILKSNGRKFTFGFLIFVFWSTFTYLLFQNLSLAEIPHWFTIGAPLVFASSLLLLFPPTEEWIYKPWQRKPQTVERHFLD